MEALLTAPIPEGYRHRTALSPAEAADMLGIHRSTFYRQIMPFVWGGEIRSLKIGARRCILLESLLTWVQQRGGIASTPSAEEDV